MNIFGEFLPNMGEAGVVWDFWVRCVAAKNNFLDAKALGGAKNRTYIMSAADIVSYEDNFFHEVYYSL